MLSRNAAIERLRREPADGAAECRGEEPEIET
jgi:hypothetical protein